MAGDRLDREAVRRRAEAAADALRRPTRYGLGPQVVYASAADVPALLDALEAAEAENERWKDVAARLVSAILANGPWGHGLMPGQTAIMDALAAYDALRTEGGAS